jgi:hypothetical protein
LADTKHLADVWKTNYDYERPPIPGRHNAEPILGKWTEKTELAITKTVTANRPNQLGTPNQRGTMSDEFEQSYRNSRTEILAVAQAERSMVINTTLTPARPSVDLGVDFLGFRNSPFNAYPVQVKGTNGGFKVFSKYADEPSIIVYVFNPGETDMETFVMLGSEAWNLPLLYIERGNKAGSHHPTLNNHYNFSQVTAGLRAILEELYRDTAENWVRILSAIDELRTERSKTFPA